MDRKVLFENVRKAYRLLFEVQDSIVELVEYIRSRIRLDDCAAKQIFSDPISQRKSDVDGSGAKNYFGGGMWSWDYFPPFMYMYYFKTPSLGNLESCFNIIQVMDDGAKEADFDSGIVPAPAKFVKAEKSQSYMLFAFSIWENTHRAIWFDGSPKDGDKARVLRDEVFRITSLIEEGDNPLIIADSNYPHDYFILKKINMCDIGNKEEADEALTAFALDIKRITGYSLLSEA